MGKISKISIDYEVRLIEAVREQKALYDKRVDGYHKNKDLIWQEVARQVDYPGLGGVECLNYWKSLRSQFMSHKRKLSKPSGSGHTSRPYFRHEESMRFINDSLGQEKTYSNLDAEVDSPDGTNETPVDQGDENEEATPARQASDHRSHTKQPPKRKLDPFDEGLLNLLKSEDKDEYASF